MNNKDTKTTEKDISRIIDEIKNIGASSAGWSLRNKQAANEVLTFIKENDDCNMKRLADEIYRYYENIPKDNTEINFNNFGNVCNDCEHILIYGTDKKNDAGLRHIDYNLNDCGKYLDFVSYLKDKHNFFYEVSNDFNSFYIVETSKMTDNNIKELDKKYVRMIDKYDEINKKVESYDNNTSSLVFTIASLFLGVSLVSGVASGLKNMSQKTILIYVPLLTWITCFTICLSSLLLGINFEKRKKGIYTTMIISTVVLIIFIIIYLKYK